jgi:hypothetical protein
MLEKGLLHKQVLQDVEQALSWSLLSLSGAVWVKVWSEHQFKLLLLIRCHVK